MKCLLIGFLLSLSVNVLAQKSTVRVVVCLYERIDFNTDYPLSELGEINNIDDLKVYDSLIKLLGSQLTLFSNRDVVYEVLNQQESYYFTQKAKKYEMSNPSRKGIDLSNISYREFAVFMDNHKADYILFINYYSIDKYRIDENTMELLKRTTSSQSLPLLMANRSRPFYSEHLIDFDVFDQNKNLFFSKGRFASPIVKYDPSTLNDKGLDFKTIKKSYKELANKIWQEIAKEVEESRAKEEQSIDQ